MKTLAEINQELKIRAAQLADIDAQLKANAIQALEIDAQIEKCENECDELRSESQKARRVWEEADLALDKLQDAKQEEKDGLYKTSRRLARTRHQLHHKRQYDIK